MIPLIRAHRQAQTSGLSGPQRANADNSLNALKLRAMAILFHECNHSMRVSVSQALCPTDTHVLTAVQMTASLYTPDRLRGWHMQSNSALDGSVRRGEGGWWVEEVTFGGSIEVQELAIEVGPPWLQFTLEAIDVPQGPIRRLLAFVKGEESWWSPAFSDVKRIVDGRSSCLKYVFVMLNANRDEEHKRAAPSGGV